MPFIDIAIAAVPTANKDAHVAHSSQAGEAFRDHGAQRYVECWGSEVPDGEVTSFLKAVQCGDDETVAVSLAFWPDQESRNAAMPKIMSDPRMSFDAMPFDGKRLIFAGFETVVDL
jgi:uncharacterized protein YbaA (DUF1428 family)